MTKEEDQQIDALLPTDEREEITEEVVESSEEEAVEEDGLESSPPVKEPQEVKWSQEQLEELKRAVAPPPAKEPVKEEPEFDENDFKRQVGYQPMDPIKLQRLYDLDTPLEERQQIMDEFQKATFDSAVRASNYIQQKEIQALKEKARQYEQHLQQQEIQKQANYAQERLLADHPITAKYPKLTEAVATQIAREMQGQFQPTKEGITKLNKTIADRVVALGKELNLDMSQKNLSQKKTPPPNLGGGQAGQGSTQKPPSKEKTFEEAAWERTLQRLNLK